MTGVRKARQRLGDSWKRGGIRSVSSDTFSYLAWKIAGSGSGIDDTPGGVDIRLEQLESAVGVLASQDRYRAATPRSTPLVSVILPTRDRPELLRRAVGTVLDQSYVNWELLIVDDTPEPEPATAASQIEDRRIRRLETGGEGVGAARNRGLDEAGGEIVSFLDDDNLMDRNWLKTVVLTLEANPNTQVVVGAQVVLAEPGSADPPRLRYPSFDWETLIRYNFVDLGMVAHRSSADLRFDESLPAFLDWDYVVRLTADHPPLMIPALSGTYVTDAPGRISYQDRRQLQQELQQRFASLRPGSAASDPTSESRISRDDLTAIEALLRALSDRSPSKPDIVELGSPRVSSALPGSTSRFGLNWEHSESSSPAIPRRYDLVIVHSPTESGVDALLKPGGLVLGLDAHFAPYTERYTQLPHRRRVGDALWIGSLDPLDLEGLFPGAALVKLGFDDPRANATDGETETIG